jgi:isoquinoline 1-oxidoreductase beta subunit
MSMLGITINGVARELDVANDMPLLWVLRDTLGLKGTKYGCGVGGCGICTVLADGEPLRSCVVSTGDIGGRDIVTIEGLAQQGHSLLAAWVQEQVPQCGYCQPAQILTAAALLRRDPQPGDAEIDAAMSGVLCRCGTYQRVRRAIQSAARSDPGAARALRSRPPLSEPGVALDDWIRIAADGTVTVMINHSEMGQGVSTALATLVAEELEADPDRIGVEFAPADERYRNPLFNEQSTGGSTSVRGEWERLSLAGARARLRLIEAAARQWDVPPGECIAEAGAVVHRPSGSRLGYGALAPVAARIAPPPEVTLKEPEQCRLLGRGLPRLDIPDMVGGRTVYGMDVSLSGMRVATVARCPVFGGRVKSFDRTAALAVPGVEQVVEIGRGVAVVARDTWAALRGRDALQVTWDFGPCERLDSGAVHARLAAALDHPGAVRQSTGHAEQAFARAARIVEAEYETAALAHGTLEPMNCLARIAADGCEVWLGTQSQDGSRETAARVSGVPLERVQVQSQTLGGGFGRRFETDMVEEAVATAKAIGAPVQVVWTRADDFRHDHYRPAFVSRVRAALDADGLPLGWIQRNCGQSAAGEGHTDLGYAIPHIHSEFVAVDSPVPQGAWRAVGAGQDAFAVESFIDELAHAAGKDPFEYRRALLLNAPRKRAVLELAARAAGWDEAAPAGRYRGIAVYRSFGSYVAQVAEVSVGGVGVRVHRVVCAIDCGRTVNPDIIRAQMEGGVAMGLSAALKEGVTIEHGRVIQGSFADYPILSFAEMPQVEVHIAASAEAPGGVGEPGLPPLAPAVANAVAAATGLRPRTLPLRLG